MKMVNVGILGAGGIAKVHASILQKDERVNIVGVADIFREKAETLAQEIGDQVKPVETLEDLFELGVDAVYVTTPNTKHVDPVLKCLANNVNVFSEKPMATSLDEAKQIKEAAQNSKALYNLGMNRRYAYVYKEVKELIQSEKLVPYMSSLKMNRGELLHPAWTADPIVTGGFLYETPVHLFDLCRYLFGEVKTLRCEARQTLSTSELDNFAILLTFESGVIATFVTSAHAGWSFPFEQIEIYGKYSTVRTEEMEKVVCSLGLKQKATMYDFSQVPFEEKWGYVEEDRLFIDAILNGNKPPVTAEDGYLTTLLVESVYESAKTGQEINIAELRVGVTK